LVIWNRNKKKQSKAAVLYNTVAIDKELSDAASQPGSQASSRNKDGKQQAS